MQINPVCPLPKASIHTMHLASKNIFKTQRSNQPTKRVSFALKNDELCGEVFFSYDRKTSPQL